MIINIRQGNLLTWGHQHVIFGINCEGVCDAGFAGAVASEYWPELKFIGEHDLGTAVSCKADEGRTFHALVCHSLETGGWWRRMSRRRSICPSRCWSHRCRSPRPSRSCGTSLASTTTAYGASRRASPWASSTSMRGTMPLGLMIYLHAPEYDGPALEAAHGNPKAEWNSRRKMYTGKDQP